jgi:hypothetical protein
MHPCWTIGRAIAATLSLLLVGFGLKFLFDGHQLHQDFERWETAKPVDGAIELSVPGRFVLPFDQTCSSSHGETVALRVPAEALQGTTVAQLLAGLNVKLEITDKSGSHVVASADSETILGAEKLDGAIPIFKIAPFRKGTYEARVTVIEGAPALRGIAQRLEGRYLLCGLERMPAVIASAIGAVSAGIGSIKLGTQRPVRMVRPAAGLPMAQPPQPAAQLPHDRVHGSLEAPGNPNALRRGETLAASSTSRTTHDMSPSTDRPS